VVADDPAAGVNGERGGGKPELFVDLLGHAVLVIVGVLASVGDDDTGICIKGREGVGDGKQLVLVADGRQRRGPETRHVGGDVAQSLLGGAVRIVDI
jgi:hypothetical protein